MKGHQAGVHCRVVLARLLSLLSCTDQLFRDYQSLFLSMLDREVLIAVQETASH